MNKAWFVAGFYVPSKGIRIFNNSYTKNLQAQVAVA
jgi:hypothetical protein